METTTMKRPETVALTYDKSNPAAKKALDFFLSLGLFQVEKIAKSQVETGLEEYRQGKYTVVNKARVNSFKAALQETGVMSANIAQNGIDGYKTLDDLLSED